MENFSQATVLITGGTGSFGRTVVAHLLESTDVREIRVFSRDEEKQDAMRTELDTDRVKFYIGDVRDHVSVDFAMQGVSYVFHAAALKQVPSCEFFPLQAVQTNILGSSNVIASALQNRVKSVVCLSTDKAVYPVNAMGMTKAVMEKVAQAMCRHDDNGSTCISCVRYGNVMFSRGSVIPLFIRQIKSGKLLTITEPAMTRFLLPLRDAVDLVEFALANARPGDIFIRKAPACTIGDLAQAIQNLFDVKNLIKIIGMRHGEKMYETLASAEELRRSEDMGPYYRVKMDTRGLNYSKFFTEGDIKEVSTEDYNSSNADRIGVKQIEELLLSLPEVQRELK